MEMLGRLENPSLGVEQDQLFLMVQRKEGAAHLKADNGAVSLDSFEATTLEWEQVRGLGRLQRKGVFKEHQGLCVIVTDLSSLHVAAGHGSNGKIGDQVLALGGAEHLFLPLSFEGPIKMRGNVIECDEEYKLGSECSGICLSH